MVDFVAPSRRYRTIYTKEVALESLSEGGTGLMFGGPASWWAARKVD